MIEAILTLLMLVALQAVLGFDKLLYTSHWKPKEYQKKLLAENEKAMSQND